MTSTTGVTRIGEEVAESFIGREAGAARNGFGRGFNSHLRYHFTGCARLAVDDTAASEKCH
jgi:hypothetical protein